MSPNEVREAIAHHNAGRHLALYARTGNGAFLLKARAEYRKKRIPMPEALEREFDLMATQAIAAQRVSDVAAAMRMQQGAKRTSEQEAARDLVEYVVQAKKHGHSPEVIYAEAAKKFNRTRAAVKSCLRDWEKEPPKERCLQQQHWHPKVIS